MKRTINLIAIIAIFFAGSCKKEKNTLDVRQKEPNVEAIEQSPDISSNPNGFDGQISKQHVYMYNGEYITQYGMGISFGSSFPYPLSISPNSDGTLFYPSISGGFPFNNNALLEFHHVGSYFTVTYSRFVTSLSLNTQAKLADYYTAFSDFINGTKDANGAYKQPALPTLTSDVTDYVFVFNGQFILDHTSPTNVSVCAMNFVRGPIIVE